jgi:hypothetical protein
VRGEQTPEEMENSGGLREVDGEALIEWRVPWPGRVWRWALASLTLTIVTLVAYVLSAPSLRQANASLKVTPTITPDGLPLVEVEANVSYGIVTIDGQNLGSPPVVFQPRITGDTVTISPSPFKAQTCAIFFQGSDEGDSLFASQDLPPGQTIRNPETCNTGSNSPGDRFTYQNRAVIVSNAVYFQFGMQDLPPAAQASAETTAIHFLQSLTQTVAVQAGDYYATGQDARGLIQAQQATTPITASFSLTPANPGAATAATPIDSSCLHSICENSGIVFMPDPMVGPGAERLWSVGLLLLAHWRFTSAQGATIGAEDIPNSEPQMSIILALSDTNIWRVVGLSSHPPGSESLTTQARQQFFANFCSVGWDEWSDEWALETSADTSTTPSAGMGVQHDAGINGCEMQLQDISGAPLGTLIWRFGVLLAADRATHISFPWLPLAPPAEISAFTQS